MQSQVGRILQHRFELQALLGRGGLLYTLRAWDRLEGTMTVVKVIPPHRLPATSARQLVTLYVALPHWQVPGICPLVDVLSEPEVIGWVRACAPGRSLGELLARAGRLSWTEALQLLRPVVERLVWLHDKGLTHGHLVPGNVFPQGEGQLWLADAGWITSLRQWGPELFARAVDPRFCAPEVLSDQHLTTAGDVYGIALLLYTAISGHPPFGVGSFAAIADQHQSRPLPSLASTGVQAPAEVEDALARWLAKTPAARPPHALALLQEWDHLLALLDQTPTQTLAPLPSAVPSPPSTAGGSSAGRTAPPSPPPSPSRNPAAPSPPAVPLHVSPSLSARLMAVGLKLIAFVLLTTLLTALLLAGIGAATYTLMCRTMPPQTQVPDVTGQSLSEAQRRLAARGLSLLISGERPSSEVPNGHVLASEPPAGRVVRERRQIRLILSTGRELVTVPNVLDFSLEAARARLERMGLHVGLEQQVWDDRVPEGRVVSQSPAAGVRVEKASEIVLAVSRGRRPSEQEDEHLEEASVKSALVRVVVPPSPPAQRLRILVRDNGGMHTAVDRYCLAGEEVNAEVRGMGEVVVEIYLNERLVTRRHL